MPPLIAAAAPVLAFAVRLRRLEAPVDVASLHASARGALQAFAQAAGKLGLTDDSLVLSQAALAALLDDQALGTAWGAAGDWNGRLLVPAVAPGLGAAGFHAEAERLVPTASVDMLELLYLCLSLRQSPDALRDRLWQRIRHPDAALGLSPEGAGLTVPPAAPSGGLFGWLRSLLRLPPAEEAALIDGLTAASNEPREADFERIYRERFIEAMKLAGPVLRANGQPLARLPWYAVIGPPGVGKTSALRSAGLKHPLHEVGVDEPLSGIAGTRHCDFWLTGQAVFLDTAGRLVGHDSDDERDRREWQSFVALLKRTRPRQPLNGVILVIGVIDVALADAAERQRHAAALRARLLDFQDKFGTTLPTYFLLTKLDLVAGFAEFFDAFDRDAREQVLGFTLPLEPDEPGDVPRWHFLPRFDRLVERQRALLADRLWSKHDAQRRALIHEFPAQFASLGRPLGELFDAIFDGAGSAVTLAPRGVYFTSAKQVGAPIDRWEPVMTGTMRAAMPPPASQEDGVGRAFFLHGIYGEVLPGEAGLVATLSRRKA